MSATDYVVCLNGHICCSRTQTVASNHNYKAFSDRASNTLSIYEHKHDHTFSKWYNKRNLMLDDFFIRALLLVWG